VTGADACTACSAPLRADRADCERCGKVDVARARELNRASYEAYQRNRGARVAVRVLLYGSVVLAIAIVLIESTLAPSPWRAATEHLLFVALAVAGLVPLGAGGFRASLGGPPRAAHVGPTLLAGLVGGAVWWAWNWILLWALGGLAFGGPNRVDAFFLVSAVFLPPLLQEWLCRGVTWDALGRIQSPRAQRLITALQGAVIYGVGWRPLAIPSRFVLGLILGRLRERTGSLFPCVVAHLIAKGIAFLPYLGLEGGGG
jgi:membrane protease YdiL (CAAX protease family)